MFSTDAILNLMAFASDTNFPERSFTEVPEGSTWVQNGQGCWVWTNHPEPTNDTLLARPRSIRRSVGQEAVTGRQFFELACDVGNGFSVVIRWLGSH